MNDVTAQPEAQASYAKKAWQSDIIVDLIKHYGFPFIALNPGASYRGLHDSLVNYGGNQPPILLCQHEKIGVFRSVQKLQELFKAGTVRLSAGPGAFALYQFDRRDVLRYTKKDRLSAYKRIFGYGAAPVPTGSRANTDFHKLFAHFVHQVTLFWRDKRISDVIRERAYDPSFGSIAIVRPRGVTCSRMGRMNGRRTIRNPMGMRSPWPTGMPPASTRMSLETRSG